MNQSASGHSCLSRIIPTHIVDSNTAQGINCIWMMWCSPIKGQHHDLWRTVDQDGSTLDTLATGISNRNQWYTFTGRLIQAECSALLVRREVAAG